ncbi:MAG: hypothetical protein PHP22_09515 [Oscillospiraceae bacterium]|jgi:hypothetical protein|nr:hypothetical protein [Oscillospiraceae bacterium]
MLFIELIKAFFKGYNSDDTDWSIEASEWEKFCQQQASEAEQSGQASESETNPPTYSIPKNSGRWLEDAHGPRRKEPVWEAVELHLEKAMMYTDDHIVLNLSYPIIPFIQACGDPNPDAINTMLLEAMVLDEQTGRFHLLEKIVDAEACREAFRLYYESGEVRNLDEFSPEKW